MGIRNSINGGLLIEVRGDQTTVEKVKEEVSRAASGDAAIKLLKQRTMVEIRDIDQWTDEEEVIEAMIIAAGVTHDSIKLVNLRKR